MYKYKWNILINGRMILNILSTDNYDNYDFP